MKKYKICVYAISKNEEKFVDRWMDSVQEADLVVVVDTGSTDKTVEKLISRGAKVYSETIEPWRFDTARNVAMSRIPEDVDICVSNDLDEIFNKGWRETLEEAWKPEHTNAKYLFNCSFNEDGSPNKQFPMEKIHRRRGFKWIYPVHEMLEYVGEDPANTITIPELVLNHYPDTTKARSHYLPLLELSSLENPSNDRIAFWLGREYFYYKMYTECIHALKRHLSLPNAKWGEERSASMRFIAKSYEAQGDLPKALQWSYKSIGESYDTREPYLDIVKLGYKYKNWPLTASMAEAGLEIKINSGSYLREPEAWGHALHDYASIAYYFLGLYEKSYDHADAACKLSPDNRRLKNNLELIKNKLKEVSAHEKI